MLWAYLTVSPTGAWMRTEYNCRKVQRDKRRNLGNRKLLQNDFLQLTEEDTGKSGGCCLSFTVCVAATAAGKVLWESSGAGDVRGSAETEISLPLLTLWAWDFIKSSAKSLEKFPVTTARFELDLSSADSATFPTLSWVILVFGVLFSFRGSQCAPVGDVPFNQGDKIWEPCWILKRAVPGPRESSCFPSPVFSLIGATCPHWSQLNSSCSWERNSCVCVSVGLFVHPQSYECAIKIFIFLKQL